MSLGNVLGAVAPIAAGYFGGPALAAATGWGTTASSIAAGALAGGGIAALSGGDILGGAAMGGLGGMGGGSLASAFNPATAVNAATTAGTTTAVANNALLSPYTSLAPGINAAGTAGANVGMMGSSGALGKTAAQQLSGGITTINPGVTGALSPVPKGNFAGLGMQNVAKPTTGFASKTPGVIDPTNPGASGGYTGYTGNPPPPDTSFMASMERLGGGPGKEAMGMGKLGLTAAPVLSAAFTPEPLSYDDYNKDEKYDPNRSLNLNMDTGINEALTKDSGLRLYADGGPVSTGADSSGLPIGTTYKNMVASGTDPLTAATRLKLPNVPGGNYPDYVNPLATPYEQTGIASLSGSTDEERLASLRSPTPVYGGGYDESEFIRSAGENSGVYATPSGGGTTRRIYEKMRNEGYAGGGTVQPQAGGGGGGGVNNLLRNMMEGTAQNMQTTGVPEGMSIADVIRAGRGYMPGPKGGVKLAQGGYLDGGMLPGDGMSDDVPANIDGEQEAALSQGEFVVPADVVSHLGNGSSDAGSKKTLCYDG